MAQYFPNGKNFSAVAASAEYNAYVPQYFLRAWMRVAPVGRMSDLAQMGQDQDCRFMSAFALVKSGLRTWRHQMKRMVFLGVIALIGWSTLVHAKDSRCAKFLSNDACLSLSASIKPKSPLDGKATQNRNCCLGCDRCNGHPDPTTPSGCAACSVR
jgi:hypothetical protein